MCDLVDYHLALKSNLFQVLTAFYDSSLSNEDERRKIMQVGVIILRNN